MAGRENPNGIPSNKPRVGAEGATLGNVPPESVWMGDGVQDAPLRDVLARWPWIARKGELHGFSLPQLTSFDLSELTQERIDVRISQEQMLRGNQHSGNGIRIFSVLYDGILSVTEPDNFRDVLQTGIGHGKVMGLGLLSVAPIG